MPPADRIAVGRVGKPHGLDGSFVVEQASDDERWFAVGARLRVGSEQAQVVGARHAAGRPVIRLDRPVARGAALEVERSELPETAEDEYYAFQLVGLAVIEEGGRALGSVARVDPGVANDVLSLDSGLALPMVSDCVRQVDLAGGRIVVAPGFSDVAP